VRRSGALIDALLLIGLVAGAAWLLQPETVVTGMASAVDGDSLRLDGKDIRLAGIDAPELHQTCLRDGQRSYPCGEVARKALSELIAGRLVTCRLGARDRYRRRLATCEAAGEDVGAALVKKGYALAYGRYQQEESAARDKRLELWSGSFEQPSQWRRTHSDPRGS
jgi:endonuclease YncB( thermonuclease family)